MKRNKILFALIPLLLLTATSCVKYNGKPKGGEKETPVTPVDPGKDDPVDPVDPVDPTPTPTPTPGGDEVPIGTDVVTYLVLGKYGTFKGNKGENIASLYLENTIKFEAKAGDALPTKEDVKSSVEGSEFTKWVAYEGKGEPTVYLTVPQAHNVILYAQFSGGTGGNYEGGGSGGGEVDDLPTSGYGILFNDNKTYEVATKSGDADFQGRTQYVCPSHSFKAGDVFQIYDFEHKAGWVTNVDEYSLGGSEGSPVWQTYFTKGESWYTVIADFNASVIIKLKYGDDMIYVG